MPRLAQRWLLAGLTAMALTGCGALPADDDPAAPPAAVPPVTKGPLAAQPAPTLSELPEQDGALTNLATIERSVGLVPYHQRGARGQRVTIAVLDNGFRGLEASIGTRLPPDTELFLAPLAQEQDTSHGLKMAEIAYAVATGSPAYRADQPGPRILLLNANGFTNFTAAVDRVIAERVDFVLYAQVWEYGGNLDGKGFVNKEVNRALAAGITWINAAGNLGLSTYEAAVTPEKEQTVRFTVPQDRTPVKVVLAWNDFTDDKDYRTKQDLDLALEDESGKSLGKGELLQDGGDPARGQLYSGQAREIVRAVLPTGTYTLRIKARSNNFLPGARLWATVDGLGVQLVDQAPAARSALIPADNPGVFTVGASDVPYSGRQLAADGKRLKPDVVVPSEVAFTSGTVHHGTSSASAIAAGALASFATIHGKLSKAALDDLIERGAIAQGGATTPQLSLEKPNHL